MTGFKGKVGSGGARVGSGRKPGTHTINQLIKLATSDRFIDSAIFDNVRNNVRISETEVRERFRILNECYQWFDVDISQQGFPDLLLRDSTGQLIRAEVECMAKDFIVHKHDINGCDLIVCWRNNWSSCPIPILVICGEWYNYQQIRKLKPFLRVK